MIHYRVQVFPDAKSAILEQARYIAADSPAAADSWIEDLWDAIDGLYRFPRRNPISERESIAAGVEVRKLVFGDYLIFYRIDDDRRMVEILQFRHGARNPT